jgi:hypothetical protein
VINTIWEYVGLILGIVMLGVWIASPHHRDR